MRPSNRKVVTRSPSKTVRVLNLNGALPGPVECESTLERDFVLRAALHPAVVNIEHQPFQLDLPDGRSYTPDFLLHMRHDRCIVVEVKVKSRIQAYRSTFELATKYLHDRGYDFTVADDTLVRCDRTHRRAARILRYLKGGFAANGCQRVLQIANSTPSTVSIGTLIAAADISLELVLHLVAQRRLLLDEHLSLELSAKVRPAQLCSTACTASDFYRVMGMRPWDVPDAPDRTHDRSADLRPLIGDGRLSASTPR